MCSIRRIKDAIANCKMELEVIEDAIKQAQEERDKLDPKGTAWEQFRYDFLYDKIRELKREKAHVKGDLRFEMETLKELQG